MLRIALYISVTSRVQRMDENMEERVVAESYGNIPCQISTFQES